MSNKTRLQTNNTNLQALIDKANALPDAGGSSGTINTVSVTVLNNATVSSVFYWDAEKTLREILPGGTTETVNPLNGVLWYNPEFGTNCTGDYLKSGLLAIQIVIFFSNGTMTCEPHSSGGGAE
jgi:hypothetical protein